MGDSVVVEAVYKEIKDEMTTPLLQKNLQKDR